MRERERERERERKERQTEQQFFKLFGKKKRHNFT